MSRIISFSLYGADRKYCEGALYNVELAPTYYPGWTCRFYVDDTVPRQYLNELENRGAEVVRVTKPSRGPMYGRYWRHWVAGDLSVDRFIVRDSDSRLNPRESAAVAAWIDSGKTFHIMRDSVHHRTFALGGMWGGLGGAVGDIEELVEGWGQYDKWGQNDQFISKILLSRTGGDYLCHDAAGHFSDGLPFPAHAPLNGTRFVGETVEVDQAPVDIWRQSAEFENRMVRAFDQLAIMATERDQICRELQATRERLAAIESSFLGRLNNAIGKLASIFEKRLQRAR